VDLDLAQVRAFVAVVDCGHFGRAAQTLTLSQQALSKRVARLEDGLGRPLLQRGPRGVTLTAAGQRFLPSARTLLEVAERAVSDVHGVAPPALRVDVWGELQSPAHAVRAVAAQRADLVVELSMRRDLIDALAALQRHELDLAFGNLDALPGPLPGTLTAELLMSDRIAALVSTKSPLVSRGEVRPGDLVRSGIWWPMAGSSQELRAFAESYARAIAAPLIADGANLGLDALVRRVADDPALVAPVVASWPLTGRSDVRMLPLRPALHYRWHAIWRTATTHPLLAPVLQALRSATPVLPTGCEVPS
jgi:DNA-binding transcriptional LysR family regulator